MIITGRRKLYTRCLVSGRDSGVYYRKQPPMPEKEIRFLDAAGTTQRLPAEAMLQQLGVGSVIRIRTAEFPVAAQPGQKFWHINLPIQDGGLGEWVLLAEIIENGRATPDQNLPPLLSFEHALLAKTIFYLKDVPQTVFSPTWIEHAIGLRSVADIPTTIHSRYGKVRGLSLEDVATTNIAIRQFKIKKLVGNSVLKALQ